MNSMFTALKARTATEEPSFALDFLIVYDSPTARERAFTLLNRLGLELDQDYDLGCAWCSFDQLSDRSQFEAAQRAAIAAQMVIVSVARTEALPVKAQQWMSQWIDQKRGQNSALVALVGLPEDLLRTPSPAQVYLEKLAAFSGMEFFSHSYPISTTSPATGNYSEDLHVEANAATEDFTLSSRPHQHWGINE